MGMNRKIKKAQAKQSSISNDMINYLKANLGVSENVGEREPFSSGRIKERVGDKRPTEKQLLQQFSKTKLEEDFKKMTKFTELYAEFDELFTDDIQAIKLDLLNKTWTEDKVSLYFTEMEDTCLDLMNSMADLASYAKNKEYKKLQERILEASKAFTPRMIGIYTSFKEKPSNMSEIILKIRAVQGRYAGGAAFQASQQNKPIATIEDRTYAILDYNESMKALSKNPMYAISNQMINEAKPKNQKKKIETIAANYINDDSIPSYCPIMLGGKKQTAKQAKKFCDIYNDLEDKLEVLQSFLNEDQTFNFEKAKQVFKESGTNLGSVELYLADLKASFDEILSVNRSLFELYIADQIINRTVTVKTVMEDYGFDFNLGAYEETYQSLLEAIKITTGHFFMFAHRKGLSWTNDTEARKTNTKFLKEIDKYGLDRKVEQPKRKKSIQSDAAVDQYYKDKGVDVDKVADFAKKIEEIETWVSNREYIFTPTHLNLETFVTKNPTEADQLKYLKTYDLVNFTHNEEKDVFMKLFAPIKNQWDEIETELILAKKSIEKEGFKFFSTVFKSEQTVNPKEAYKSIKRLISDSLLCINNLISISKYAIEFKHEEVLKLIIDTLNNYLEKNGIAGEDKICQESLIPFLEEFTFMTIPHVLIYANAKDLPFYTQEDWKKLTKSFDKNDQKFFRRFTKDM